MIHGRNLIVALDGVAVAGAKSCKLQLSQDFIEACSPDSGRVHEKIPTTYDWSVSVDCLVPNSTLSVSLKDKLIEGTKCLLTFTDGSGDNRAGFVYVKSCDESGTIGSLATFSASFESTGSLMKYTKITVPDPPAACSGITMNIEENQLVYGYDGDSQGNIYIKQLNRANQSGTLYVLGTPRIYAIYDGLGENEILTIFNFKGTEQQEEAFAELAADTTKFGQNNTTYQFTTSVGTIVTDFKPILLFLY